MSYIKKYLIHFLSFQQIFCILLPSYNINLNQNETFEIYESIRNDEVSDIYDDTELIRNDNNFKENNAKYYRIHQMAMKRNKKELNDNSNQNKKIKPYKKRINEYNYDKNESIPWSGGFVDKNNNFIQPDNQKVYYLNQMAKQLIDEKIQEKREENILDVKNLTKNYELENYDYNNFKAQYDENIKEAKKLKQTLNYTDIKEDESVKDALNDLDLKKLPKNCTKEEIKGIGLGAAECLWLDFKRTTDKDMKLLIIRKFFRLVLIWFGIYLIIATALWCQKGWCCCCCRFKCCKPHQRIDEAKKFFMDNPSGVYHTENEQTITYTPTRYEKYAEEKLKHALMNVI